MKTAIIFGGSGYIGEWTCRQFASEFDRIFLVDRRPADFELPGNAEFLQGDVREKLDLQRSLKGWRGGKDDWIFNFAAVHREPGHGFQEYFDTNVPGAENVVAFAEIWGISNILFTSSIAVYGPTQGATSEESPKYPNSGYGISKLQAELIHERWLSGDIERRLVICRPGVVYGPGDPGNILRMIQAVKKRYFFFPGNRKIKKSYAYIDGLIEAFAFAMKAEERCFVFNFVESPTERLDELVKHIEDFFGRKSLNFTMPTALLVAVAGCIQIMTGGRSSIHPRRVIKAGLPTEIVPQKLIDCGFCFRYPFADSLKAWKQQAPEDF